MMEEKREKTKQRQQQQTLSEKKEEAGTVSEQRDKGWIHVIRVHDTTHLAVTTTLRGSRRSRDYPPHSYIVNERYNPKNKRGRKRKNSQWQELAQSQTITQGGHEIASLLNWNKQNVFIFMYDKTNTDKLGKYNKTPNKRQAP